MTRSETSTFMAAEYLVLLRQLAAAQRRATTLAEALARLQRQRAADEARWSAALADRDALIVGLGVGRRSAPPHPAARTSSR